MYHFVMSHLKLANLVRKENWLQSLALWSVKTANEVKRVIPVTPWHLLTLVHTSDNETFIHCKNVYGIWVAERTRVYFGNHSCFSYPRALLVQTSKITAGHWSFSDQISKVAVQQLGQSAWMANQGY